MAPDKRERIIENLAVASALGFLALLVAVVSLFVDSRSLAEERALLEVQGSSLSIAGRAGDPCFDVVYKTQGAYVMAIHLRASKGAAILAARFSSQGELQELRLLGSCSSRIGTGIKGILASLPGGEETLIRAAEYARSLANGNAGEDRS
jgi:hypothetical protein